MPTDSVYVSYSWKVEEQNLVVDKLEQACQKRGIELQRDKKRIGYGGSIRAYMDELAAGGHIVLVLSKPYFTSDYCMYELREIYNNQDFRKRVYPIVISGTHFHKPGDRVPYIKHWEEEKAKLEKELTTIRREYTRSLNAALDTYADFRRLMDKLLDILADMNILTEDIHVGTDFEALLDRITEPAWASSIGHDQYGLFAELTVKSVTQRFRWIAPGAFLMGSPEDEPEREADETRHHVTLTQGYWLADTACTQTLWRVVMESNPSCFQDDDRNPVEQVSWNDVQQFIDKLNGLIPNLNARLPTEAEWEYACRAGTTTPFSFGKNITPEQVNYNGEYPYAGSKKGLYRRKTVPVKSLSPNPWGLYEMHGNVWERCQDWFGDYLSAPVIDSVGLSEGADRVLRGGSWIGDGGSTRSAYRLRFDPDSRHNAIGFRLSLGVAARNKNRPGPQSS